MNDTEATIIARLVDDAIYMGVKPSDIGVISAYRAQIILINKALDRQGVLYPKAQMLVGTIDAFQGGEREVVIVATTRSNKKQHIGFLSSEERMNVAVTRAKRLCVFVGSSATLIRKETSFIKEFYEFTRTHGEVLWYDKFKRTFKKANTSTQMSKPAVEGPKIATPGTVTSSSTAPNSRTQNSMHSAQHQARNQYEIVPGSHKALSDWQPDPVPARYEDYRQPASSSHSGPSEYYAQQQPNWQGLMWGYPPYAPLQPFPNISDHQLASSSSYPVSRTNGSVIGTSTHRPEAAYRFRIKAINN